MARPLDSECLRGDLVCKFLKDFLETRPDGHARGEVYFLNGRRLSKPEWNNYRRWESGALRANVWIVDKFFTAFELHIDHFFIWCDMRGQSAWLLGEPPAWHDQDWVEEDKNWRDEVPVTTALPA